MDLFRAVGHAFTTIATAGFSTEARSIEPFAPATQWAIVVFMVVAGTNFTLLYAGILRRTPQAFPRDEEFRLYIGVAALAAGHRDQHALRAEVLAQMTQTSPVALRLRWAPFGITPPPSWARACPPRARTPPGSPYDRGVTI
jgi:hypothetical protein